MKLPDSELLGIIIQVRTKLMQERESIKLISLYECICHFFGDVGVQ